MMLVTGGTHGIGRACVERLALSSPSVTAAMTRHAACGMGVCQECIVTIDGQPSRRACMDKAADGMNVTSQDYAPSLPPPLDSGAKRVVEKHAQVHR